MQLLERETIDPLTQLLLRAPGKEMIDHLIDLICGGQYPGSVSALVIDLDHFGLLNKRYGMSTGDAVLQWAAHILRRKVRKEDRSVRWGGDEFVICTHSLHVPKSQGYQDERRKTPRPSVPGEDIDRRRTPDLTKTGQTDADLGRVLHNGQIVASRIMAAMKAGPCMVGGETIHQEATIGVATLVFEPGKETHDIFDRLVHAADQMIAQAKRTNQRGEIHVAKSTLR